MSNKMRLFIGGLAALTVASLFVALNGKGQTNRQAKPTPYPVPFGQAAKELDDAATPIADFDNPPITDRIKKNERKTKNARYDKWGAVRNQPHPNAGEVIVEPEWRSGQAPADLPADRSVLIVEAIVADSKAFLSTDKTGVYSEFTISVSRILKVAPRLSVNVGDLVVIERFGGKVRYASGQVIRIRIDGQGVPIVNNKYLFFLSKNDQDSYRLLTAYEIKGNQVFALDGSRTNFRGKGDSVFDKHNGEDLETFREKVERVINASRGEGRLP